MEQICQPALYIIMNDYDGENYEENNRKEKKRQNKRSNHTNVLLKNMQPSEVWIRIDGSRLILIACKHTFDMEQASLSSSGAQFLSEGKRNYAITSAYNELFSLQQTS